MIVSSQDETKRLHFLVGRLLFIVSSQQTSFAYIYNYLPRSNNSPQPILWVLVADPRQLAFALTQAFAKGTGENHKPILLLVENQNHEQPTDKISN